MLTNGQLSKVSSVGVSAISGLHENSGMRDITSLMQAAIGCLPEREQEDSHQHVAKT